MPSCRPLAFALCWALFAGASLAAGKVEVKFIEPEHFTDIGRGGIERERVLTDLSRYLVGLAGKLPEGQSLQVEVTDIALAGRLRPTSINDIRVMRGGIDGPRISLRYTLQDQTHVLKAGTDELSDVNYLYNRRGLPLGEPALAYEKRLVTQWFDSNFKAH
jgi:hypothetical protein